MKRTLFYISLIVMFGCGKQNQAYIESQKQENLKETEIQNEETVEVSTNTMTVKANHVIFLWPDSIEIAEMQETIPEDEYNEIIADMTWYPGIASEILDSLGINYVHCNKEFLVLIKSDKTEIKLMRKDIDGNMILFNIDKEPFISYAVSFDEEATLEYFDFK